MPIKADHSEMPTVNRDRQGWEPDERPIFGPILVSSLRAAGQRESKTREYIRPSDAMKCARQISFAANGTEGTPMDPSGWWVTSLGNLIHEMFRQPVIDHFGPSNVTIEELIGNKVFKEDGSVDYVEPEIVTVRGVDIPVVSYIDVRVHSPELSLVSDFKSVGGYAYKMAVGERGTADGPKPEHMIQAGIGALIRGAEFVSVTYIAKDSISKAIAKRKGFDVWRQFTAEWTVPLAEIRTQVEDEMLRLWSINRLWHEEGLIAKRMVPGVPAEISAPKDGSWALYEQEDVGNDETDLKLIRTGNYWGCSYCGWQNACILAGPGRVPMPEAESVETRVDL